MALVPAVANFSLEQLTEEAANVFYWRVARTPSDGERQAFIQKAGERSREWLMTFITRMREPSTAHDEGIARLEQLLEEIQGLESRCDVLVHPKEELAIAFALSTEELNAHYEDLKRRLRSPCLPPTTHNTTVRSSSESPLPRSEELALRQRCPNCAEMEAKFIQMASEFSDLKQREDTEAAIHMEQLQAQFNPKTQADLYIASEQFEQDCEDARAQLKNMR